MLKELFNQECCGSVYINTKGEMPIKYELENSKQRDDFGDIGIAWITLSKRILKEYY